MTNPSAGDRLAGGLLMAVGGLIAGLSGLCTGGAEVFLFVHFDGKASQVGEYIVTALMPPIVIGMIPFLIGLALFFAGRGLLRPPRK